jgi:hypothetical protein
VVAQQGHRSTIVPLIQAGAIVDILNKNSSTPLMLACQRGHEECVDALVKSGANVNARSRIESCPILLAAQKSFTNVVRILIAGGARVNVSNRHSQTCLMLSVASQQTNVECVQLILDAGANIDAQDNEGLTALSMVAIHADGNKAVMITKLLIDHGANLEIPSHKGHTALMLSAVIPRSHSLPLLLEAGARVDSLLLPDRQCSNHHEEEEDSRNFGSTALHLAVQHSNLSSVEQLLKAGADATLIQPHSGRNALMKACKTHNWEIIETLWMHLTQTMSPEAMRLLIDLPDAEGRTALALLLREPPLQDTNEFTRKCSHLIELFLSMGAEVNWQDQYGRTALHLSVRNDDLRALLLSVGARVDLEENDAELNQSDFQLPVGEPFDPFDSDDD